MRKIKILHIIKSLGRGGAEMLLPETLKIHDKEKFEFHYIYFLPWKDQMVSALEDAGGKVTCLEAKNNIYLFLRYKKVIEYCKSKEIDLIHCHLPWAGFLGRLVFKKTGIPVLYTEHNMQERYHTITRRINKASFNSQTIALGVSEDVKNSIVRNINPQIPVRILLNGVNTNTFQSNEELSSIRKKFNIPEDAIIIGTVSVFRFQKRLKEWLQVFSKVNGSNSNIFGLIVGAGPLESEIMEEYKRLSLQNKVFFPGLQTEVKPYLEAMDIFMMCSSFEGLPIALLESMSMGCAVVSTNAGGIKEVIRNEKDGLTCEVEEWKKLVDLNQRLIDDPIKLKEMKIAARDRVVQSFSLKKMVEELEGYYNSAI